MKPSFEGGDIVGLFDLFGKKKQTNYMDEDLNHLTPEGELPWGWFAANKKFTQRVESEYHRFSDEYAESKKQSPLSEYAALKSLVLYMEDVKRICASKGECFVEWASVLVANPVVLDSCKERLQYLEENMDDLLKHEQMIKRLKTDLLHIITEEPGVIQSELYKRFDASMKNHISNELYMMETHGAIIREKSGRSYKLYVK